MLTIEMLPAERGDCLWITYGKGAARRHVIVDAGPKETIGTLIPVLEERIKELPGSRNRIELLAMSHIDADHIQGVVSLLSGPNRVPLFRDVWFNAFKHLPAPPTLGAPDGEMLTAILENNPGRWNRAFRGGPVAIPDLGDLPTIRLEGGLELTLLSPTSAGLTKLVSKWEKECKKAGLIPGHGAEVPRSRQRTDVLGFNADVLASLPYRADRAEANGSSIAFVATFEGKSVLCAADAHSDVLEASLDRLGSGPHKFTAVKVSHHGSKANLGPKLLERVRSKNWLISTNGSKFQHPDPEALARIVKTQRKPVFHLNYVTTYVQDLINGAGNEYSVKLPRKRQDGTFETGLVVKLA
jgi:beta-lactamase superfamily II metal-dependent hydrolase